ncbi:hypothetical protein MAHJHV55_52390 [Mycobacterium avium subsp. hominissuis]
MMAPTRSRSGAELFSWGKSWLETCQQAFAGLAVDPDRVREVAALIPGAPCRGRRRSPAGVPTPGRASRRGLTNALAAYLEQSRP